MKEHNKVNEHSTLHSAFSVTRRGATIAISAALASLLFVSSGCEEVANAKKAIDKEIVQEMKADERTSINDAFEQLKPAAVEYEKIQKKLEEISPGDLDSLVAALDRGSKCFQMISSVDTATCPDDFRAIYTKIREDAMLLQNYYTLVVALIRQENPDASKHLTESLQAEARMRSNMIELMAIAKKYDVSM